MRPKHAGFKAHGHGMMDRKDASDKQDFGDDADCESGLQFAPPVLLLVAFCNKERLPKEWFCFISGGTIDCFTLGDEGSSTRPQSEQESDGRSDEQDEPDKEHPPIELR